jgi:transmembrane sensor
MKQQHDNIDWKLIARHLGKELDGPERERLLQWASESDKNRQELENAEKIWQNSSVEQADLFNTDQGWGKMNERIHKHKRGFPNRHQISTTLMQIAAAFIILLSMGYMVYRIVGHTQFTEVTAGNQKILNPVVLPDGSNVYLNVGASIRYPKKFNSASRTIELTGEAFFEVTHRKDCPFIIQTPHAQVKVLGTSFNVLANRQSDSVQVVVQTGTVELSSKTQSENIKITKGNTGVYHLLTNKLSSSALSDVNALAWKTEIIVFHDADLSYIARTLSKLFMQPVQLSNEKLKNCRLNSDFKHENLDDIFKTIKEVLKVDIHKTKDGYIISGEGC